MPPVAQIEDFKLTDFEKDIAKKWGELASEEDRVRLLWERLDRRRKKFAKAAGLGRKRQIVVRISETHCVKVVNQFRGSDRVFTPAFARRLDISKIKLPTD